MNEHRFLMRLISRYKDPDNSIADLKVELCVDDEWQVFELNEQSSGFLIFVYAMFNCQHMYMRLNCAERGLMLESASGAIEVMAGEDWIMRKLHVHFDARLKSGSPVADDATYIIERMQQCPVSINLKDVADSKTELFLE
ncbi:MAG: hypothetical protein WBN51_08330 [Gammaproteobacteria bacterium]